MKLKWTNTQPRFLCLEKFQTLPLPWSQAWPLWQPRGPARIKGRSWLEQRPPAPSCPSGDVCGKVTEHLGAPRQGPGPSCWTGFSPWSQRADTCRTRLACQSQECGLPGERSGQSPLNQSLSFLGIRHSQKVQQSFSQASHCFKLAAGWSLLKLCFWKYSYDRDKNGSYCFSWAGRGGGDRHIHWGRAAWFWLPPTSPGNSLLLFRLLQIETTEFSCPWRKTLNSHLDILISALTWTDKLRQNKTQKIQKSEKRNPPSQADETWTTRQAAPFAASKIPWAGGAIYHDMRR